MIRFAQINNNNMVTNITVMEESVADQAPQILSSIEGEWIRVEEGSPVSVNGYWSPEQNKFYGKQLFPSWSLNQETLIWEAPTPMPVVEGKMYQWVEDDLNWQEIALL